ncbi:3-hydroxybutyryl-dehydrogenase [Colletotrichum tofieldiae]|uniref:3-hydroxybutyryl-dehydrogenase n=1 Tax=Colletotrichum tofieldiae TaxID=708197 RepID=A0A166N3V1_9PEZI|nr:3-hydroxybutyryl-dehydrogenase [Colletotrichum tofieldiae]
MAAAARALLAMPHSLATSPAIRGGQWISDAKKQNRALPQTSRHQAPLATETVNLDYPDIVSQDQLESLLTECTSNSSNSIRVPHGIEVFHTLDGYSAKETNRYDPNHECDEISDKRKKDDRINQSLRITIQAFTARWLPLILNRTNSQTDEVEEVIRKTWRAARNDMLKVLNRVSYRSVLTLFLFSQTPIPPGISEDEEEDGISGLAGVWASTITGSISDPSCAEEYLQLENRIYWAAVIWDTSSSLVFNLRASLTSGLKGACLEPVWLLARAFLVGSFHPQTETWRTNGFQVTDETAMKILSGAAVGNIYIWKTITSLKEALREGVAEDSLLLTWRALLDAIDIYQTSIRPLLNTCEKKLHHLDQERRLCWFEVSLKYHLGILAMVDALEVAKRLDMLAQIRDLGQETESEIFNVLKFGVDSTYTIRCARERASEIGSDRTTQAPYQMVMTSVIAIHPLASIVVDAVALAQKTITSKHSQGKIKDEVYSYLDSMLVKALGQLTQHPQRVTLARKDL